MLGGAEAPPSKKTKEVKASSRGTKREEPVRVFDPGGSESDKLPGDGKLDRVTSLSFGRGVCRKYSTKDSYRESLSEWSLRVLCVKMPGTAEVAVAVVVWDPGGSGVDILSNESELCSIASLSVGNELYSSCGNDGSYSECCRRWLLRVLRYAVCKSVQKTTVRQVVRVVAKLMLSHSEYRIRNDSRFISVSYEADGCRQLLQLMKCSIEAIMFCVKSTGDEDLFGHNSGLDQVAAVLKIQTFV